MSDFPDVSSRNRYIRDRLIQDLESPSTTSTEEISNDYHKNANYSVR